MDIKGYKINNKTGIIEGCPSNKYKLKEVEQYREIVIWLIIQENLREEKKGDKLCQKR